MKRHPVVYDVWAGILLAGLGFAQTQAQAPHDHVATTGRSATQVAQPDHSQTLTLAGCLMREKDVPAAKGASLPEAGGYVLVAVRALSHHQDPTGMRSAPAANSVSAPHAHDAGQSAKSEPVAAPVDSSRERIADRPIFRLAGVPLERLAAMKGRQVQVDGHIDAATVVDTQRDPNNRSSAELGAATFVVATIHAVDGVCPKQ